MMPDELDVVGEDADNLAHAVLSLVRHRMQVLLRLLPPQPPRPSIKSVALARPMCAFLMGT